MKVKNLKGREERTKNVKKQKRKTGSAPVEFRPEDLQDSGRKPSKKKSRSKQKKASTGKEYVFISYCFVGVFLALIGYLVYFNVELADDYANSPYNSKRQGTYQERVVKGEIRAAEAPRKILKEKNFVCTRMRMYLLMWWVILLRESADWSRV